MWSAAKLPVVTKPSRGTQLTSYTWQRALFPLDSKHNWSKIWFIYLWIQLEQELATCTTLLLTVKLHRHPSASKLPLVFWFIFVSFLVVHWLNNLALHMHTVRSHSQTVLQGNNTTPAAVMVPLYITGGIQLAIALLSGRYPSGCSVVCDSVLLRSCLFHVCVAHLLTVTASTFLEQTWWPCACKEKYPVTRWLHCDPGCSCKYCTYWSDHVLKGMKWGIRKVTW